MQDACTHNIDDAFWVAAGTRVLGVNGELAHVREGLVSRCRDGSKAAGIWEIQGPLLSGHVNVDHAISGYSVHLVKGASQFGIGEDGHRRGGEVLHRVDVVRQLVHKTTESYWDFVYGLGGHHLLLAQPGDPTPSLPGASEKPFWRGIGLSLSWYLLLPSTLKSKHKKKKIQQIKLANKLLFFLRKKKMTICH